MLQCVAVCCSVLQRVATCCSAMHYVAVRFPERVFYRVGWPEQETVHRLISCVAACCSVLQRVAVCCSVLQCSTRWPQRGDCINSGVLCKRAPFLNKTQLFSISF